MSLENGSQLGSYKILGPLGAGGMGEVYRAGDAKLDREVAIKVLPESMAHDLERVARFYFPGNDAQERPAQKIYQYALDGDGKPEPFTSQTGDFLFFDISPDGRFVAVQVDNSDDRNSDYDGTRIHVLDTNRDVMTVLNTAPGRQRMPLFSPDGEWVYYQNGADENQQTIVRHRTDGSGEAELVYETPEKASSWLGSFSPDGKELYIFERTRDVGSSDFDIAVLHLGESSEMVRKETWYAGPERQVEPVVSPNGRWVAFNSRHEGNTNRLYVRRSDGEGGLYPVSGRSGMRSKWSPDGSVLYFLDNSERQTQLIAAEVISGHQTTADAAESHFEVGQINTALETDERFFFYQIAPDGESVLVIHDAKPDGEDAEQNQEEAVDDLTVIQVVRNFFTELE